MLHYRPFLEAIDKGFGKKSTADCLQQEFFQLQQDKGERIQHFTTQLERAFKKLQEAFPQRYGQEQLKERLFHGVNQQMRDSMRFLYMKETTTYDTLLAVIKEVEIEWLESKGQIRMKSATVVDHRDEIEELRKKLDQLTTTVKSNNFKGTKRFSVRIENELSKKEGRPKKKLEGPRDNFSWTL